MSYSTDDGLARLIWQYQNSPKVKALIASVLAEFEDIGAATEELRTRLDIDASFGEQLDGIGEIVGQPRPSTEEIDPSEVFSFDGPDAGAGFSGIGRPDQGGRFTGLDGIVVGPMPDDEYRVLLRAAIFGNSGLSTLDHLNGYARAVLGEGASFFDGVGYVNLSVDRPLSPTEARLIRKTVPLAAGVRLGYISYSVTPSDGPGGFDDVTGTGSTESGEFVGLA
ncbi:MAG: hypothetical protein Unbinned3138contig1000_28 [Prokaryotic dsDNA virus sp.]|nr:MAG: hypothetical protein Unbinned3138contig1000_28 [Prokaryotic dsDNA virus sp.]|tara:strand:- start:438 stop:1106 length:669 start_codon:yes stop_codon:yes gene_type:complete